jgi:hypothetical protein
LIQFNPKINKFGPLCNARSGIRDAAVSTLNTIIDYITPSFMKSKDSQAGGTSNARDAMTSQPQTATGSMLLSAPVTNHAPSPIVGNLQSSMRNINNNLNNEPPLNGFKPRTSEQLFGASSSVSFSAAAGAPLILAGTSSPVSRRSLWSDLPSGLALSRPSSSGVFR